MVSSPGGNTGAGDTLARRVERLEDVQGIQEVMSKYCNGFDHRRIDLFLDQFEPDGVFIMGKRYEGRGAIGRMAERRLGVTRHSLHLIGNVRIEFDDRVPGLARATSDCLAAIDGTDGLVRLVLADYVDTLNKRTGAWRLVERVANLHQTLTLATTPEATKG